MVIGTCYVVARRLKYRGFTTTPDGKLMLTILGGLQSLREA